MKNINNYTQLIGRVGKSVDLKEFETGNKKASFSLATNESYNDKNGKKVEKTYWHNIIAWGNVAGWMKDSLDKGDRVLVQGKLTHRKYENTNGEARYITEIVAGEFMKM